MVGSIHPVEMMETIMVNQFVPFLFINQLIPLLSNAKQLKRQQHIWQENQTEKEKVQENNNSNYQYQLENTWNQINHPLRTKYVPRSYIINVSAMEGRFHFFKQGTHPHTNMAKAALNMLKRTSGLKLAQRENVFMVSVDTGWVTDELPLKRRIRSKIFEQTKQARSVASGSGSSSSSSLDDGSGDNKSSDNYSSDLKNDFIFHPPLDEIDGAARVLHPIWSGLRGKPYCGVFLKDYRRIDW